MHSMTGKSVGGIHTTLFTDGMQHDTKETGLCLQRHRLDLDLLPDPRLGQMDQDGCFFSQNTGPT